MARESKAELTDRLRREGRWEAFKTRREELKAQGVPADQAWYRVATEFPAISSLPANGTTIPPIDLESLKGKPSIPIDKAALWVFEYLDADWITPADAPSPGAWSLLHWARSSHAARSEFYRTFVPRLWQIRAAQIEEEQKKAAGRESDRRTREQLFGRFGLHDKELDKYPGVDELFGKRKGNENPDGGSSGPGS